MSGRPKPGWRAAGWLAVFAVVVTLPLWVGGGLARLLIDVAVVAALAQGWALLAGRAGVVSLAPALSAGVGLYAWAVLAGPAGVNPVIAVAGAALAGLAVGVAAGAVILALPIGSVPVTSLVATVAAGEVVSLLDEEGRAEGRVVDGAAALGDTLRLGLSTWLAVVVGVGTVAGAAALRRSRAGLAAVAAHDAPDVAAVTGVSATRARLSIWVLASVAAATAAAVSGFEDPVVDPAGAFDVVRWTAPAAIAAVVGGLRSVAGPVVGAVVYVVITRPFDDPAAGVLVGVVAAAVVYVALPEGIAGWVAGRFPGQLRRVGGVLSRRGSSTGTTPAP